MKEEIPDEVVRYSKIADKVERGIHSKVLARIFFIIVDSMKDGENYNDAIAKKYADSPHLPKGKSRANSKVMAVNIRKLREAGIIKRLEKEGRIQKYVPDYQGLVNILIHRGSDTYESNVNKFSMSYLLYSYGKSLSDGSYSVSRLFQEKVIRLFKDIIAKEFLPKLIEAYTDWFKQTWFVGEDGKSLWDSKMEAINYKNFENVNISIHKILSGFDEAIVKIIPDWYRVELDKIPNDRKKFSIFMNLYYNMIKRRDEEFESFYSDDNPQSISLSVFDKLYKERQKVERK